MARHLNLKRRLHHPTEMLAIWIDEAFGFFDRWLIEWPLALARRKDNWRKPKQ